MIENEENKIETMQEDGYEQQLEEEAVFMKIDGELFPIEEGVSYTVPAGEAEEYGAYDDGEEVA